MKKLFFIVLALFMLCSCADKKTIHGVTYRPYGIFNGSTCKNDSVQYEISAEAVISSIIFIECVIPPIYSIGYNLWQPIGLKSDFRDGNTKGVVNE